ncbi:hypothetical protein EJ05DRAFT_258614 [Pseudovirgaria hyperparasitica]|uniref:Uncharacterized protein n=1 Tax=Pseudovirgaria hyperparasitica TaxID=470096 RepID=A0A6A6WH25_9PEZI|nr:uncharacterized protein EJ05DRAFT_258614 [Pseudovirgaria hyperparasitica]KAF2761286.1 hypothetical protein EJ05DRAFT_258614 [Pseudovirgaria hyperparasitica]
MNMAFGTLIITLAACLELENLSLAAEAFSTRRISSLRPYNDDPVISSLPLSTPTYVSHRLHKSRYHLPIDI